MMCSASVMMWSSQLETSCAHIDRRDGGSVGSGGGTCAWTSAKPDSKKTREKLCYSLLHHNRAPPDSTQRKHSRETRAMLRHTPGQTSVYSRMSQTRRSAAKLLYIRNNFAKDVVPARLSARINSTTKIGLSRVDNRLTSIKSLCRQNRLTVL